MACVPQTGPAGMRLPSGTRIGKNYIRWMGKCKLKFFLCRSFFGSGRSLPAQDAGRRSVRGRCSGGNFPVRVAKGGGRGYNGRDKGERRSPDRRELGAGNGRPKYRPGHETLPSQTVPERPGSGGRLAPRSRKALIQGSAPAQPPFCVRPQVRPGAPVVFCAPIHIQGKGKMCHA